ncbi:unnamed protein product [Amoebophrya sp. A25]|nr:unnamed protein product [Amoebophrya sp. A25]|eukprot:GSA25T00012031001.1
MRLEYSEDYERVLSKKAHSWDESKAILEYMRVNRIFQPDVAAIHGSVVLTKNASRLGDDVWAVHEQVCLAAMHLGMHAWTAYCIEKLTEKFPKSKRVKRLYALHQEAIGDFTGATKVYKDILQESPESTFARRRLIAIKRTQGKTQEAIEAATKHLETFQMDKEVWHELTEMYIQEGQLSKAAYCLEDVLIQDPRNMYTVLSYAELVFSCGQDFDLARKYFCLACEIDDTSLRALWGLFWCNQHLHKKDQGSDKMLALQSMCVQRLRSAYKPLKHVPSTKIMLALLDAELLATSGSAEAKAS